jgi:hypothetical protein
VEVIPLQKVPHELYTGCTVIQVKGGQATVCRVRQVYPVTAMEQANTTTDIDLSFFQRFPDGYYVCPPGLLKQAHFATTLALSDLLVLWAADWQTYAQQQGYRLVIYRVLADGGMVDSMLGDPSRALQLYQETKGSVHLLRLYVELYAKEGDAQPQELIELLGEGAYEDLF